MITKCHVGLFLCVCELLMCAIIGVALQVLFDILRALYTFVGKSIDVHNLMPAQYYDVHSKLFFLACCKLVFHEGPQCVSG